MSEGGWQHEHTGTPGSLPSLAGASNRVWPVFGQRQIIAVPAAADAGIPRHRHRPSAPSVRW